ncbi:MAG: hypothetical protein AB7N76_15270 [Planctomycetota bacterium]
MEPAEPEPEVETFPPTWAEMRAAAWPSRWRLLVLFVLLLPMPPFFGMPALEVRLLVLGLVSIVLAIRPIGLWSARSEALKRARRFDLDGERLLAASAGRLLVPGQRAQRGVLAITEGRLLFLVQSGSQQRVAELSGMPRRAGAAEGHDAAGAEGERLGIDLLGGEERVLAWLSARGREGAPPGTVEWTAVARPARLCDSGLRALPEWLRVATACGLVGGCLMLTLEGAGPLVSLGAALLVGGSSGLAHALRGRALVAREVWTLALAPLLLLAVAGFAGQHAFFAARQSGASLALAYGQAADAAIALLGRSDSGSIDPSPQLTLALGLALQLAFGLQTRVAPLALALGCVAGVAALSQGFDALSALGAGAMLLFSGLIGFVLVCVGIVAEASDRWLLARLEVEQLRWVEALEDVLRERGDPEELLLPLEVAAPAPEGESPEGG